MLRRVLPDDRVRTAVVSAGLVALVLLTTQVLPKRSPGGVLLFGLVAGAQNALLAAGLILIYRSSRVINFAQTMLGAAGAIFAYNLTMLLDWPFLLSFVIGLATAALVGVLVELVFVRRFFTAPRLVLTVVTVVLADALVYARSGIEGLPFFPDRRSPDVALRLADGRVPLPFEGSRFEVFPFPFGFAEVFTLVLTVTAFVGLAAFFRYTRVGVGVRAAAENAERAVHLGVNVRILSTVVWGLAGLLSGLALSLQGATSSFHVVGVWSPEVLVPALAAAVLGRMRSLPLTVVAAVSISVLQQAVFWSFPDTTLLDLVLLVVIGVGLIVQRRTVLRSEEGMTSSWEATKEIRPTPKELNEVSGVRLARRALIGVALLAVVVFPLATSPSQTNLASLIAIQAIVALSLVVLTGWAGQVSLGQFALVAVAAVVGGKLTSGVGLPFWVALPVVVALSAGFAALVGLPALRIRGAFLAVTTLAFAVAVQRILFDERYFGWLMPERVERPSLFFVRFASERSYYYLCVAAVVVVAVVVRRLRAGRTGRVLIALREDELGVQTFGINATRTRLAAFALSGGLAGIAGVLFVHHQRAVDAASFGSRVSVAMFIMAMIGGITSVSGALLGAAYVGLIEFLISDDLIRLLSTSVGLLLLLFVAPGGLAGIAYGVRDAVLRLVASRRQLIVPSLFEDYDPEALARKRWPLADPIPGRGTDSLAHDRRYVIASELYPPSAVREAERVGSGRPS